MEKKIGKNVSSGAKKVERVEDKKEYTAESVNEKPQKKTTKKTAGKKTTEKKQPVKKEKAAKRAVKKEKKAAEKRLEKAKAKAAKKEQKLLKKAELKAKKMEKKAAYKQKKLEHKELKAKRRAERKAKHLEKKAALKEKRIEKKAEKTARREMLKNESKAERNKRIAREKKERAALKAKKHEAKVKAHENKIKARRAAHARKAADKKHRREQKTERRANRRGFGGWLAAVISLGTACLALAAVVTAGAVRMNEMEITAENGARATLYEMVSVSEDLEGSLNKLRIASGTSEQRKLLADIIADTAVMESALEKIPVDQATSTDISSFVNRTNSYARSLLAQLADGKALTDTQMNTISYLYDVNAKLYNELNNLATTMTEKDFRSFMNGGDGMCKDGFCEMGNSTRQEPEEIVDAPFTNEGNVGENKLASYEEITSARGEELVREYLEGYHVRDVAFTGETNASDFTAYNYVVTDENDAEIFAQVTKNGGMLVFFDTYEECYTKNFDLETCDKIAREFLAQLGMDDVEAVWLSDGGMVANLTYVGVKNGVRMYPDMVRVRVCEEKGRVVGLEAKGYLLNHGGKRDTSAKLSMNEAKEALSSHLEVKTANKALIPVEGEEVLCYEFLCSYGEEEYMAYVDANTGVEIQLFRVRNSAQGSYLE